MLLPFTVIPLSNTQSKNRKSDVHQSARRGEKPPLSQKDLGPIKEKWTQNIKGILSQEIINVVTKNKSQRLAVLRL